MVLGLTAWAATFGLVVVFFVIFPVLVQGLIAFAIAQAFGERDDNEEYARQHRMPGTLGGAAHGPSRCRRHRRRSRHRPRDRPAPVGHPSRRPARPRRRGRRAGGGRSRRRGLGAAATSPSPTRSPPRSTTSSTECGGIDVCISNAGIAAAGALRHLDPDVLAAQLNVNLIGNWRFIHACLPHVIARRGYVLGVASLAAIVAPLGIGAYGASKAGLEQLLNVLRIEVRHLGVDVGVAYFSWIDTDMVRGAESQPSRVRRHAQGPARPGGQDAPGRRCRRRDRARRAAALAPGRRAGLRRRAVPAARPDPRADRSRGGQVRRRTSTASPPRWWPSAAPSPPACARIEQASEAAARSAGR